MYVEQVEGDGETAMKGEGRRTEGNGREEGEEGGKEDIEGWRDEMGKREQRERAGSAKIEIDRGSRERGRCGVLLLGLGGR